MDTGSRGRHRDILASSILLDYGENTKCFSGNSIKPVQILKSLKQLRKRYVM